VPWIVPKKYPHLEPRSAAVGVGMVLRVTETKANENRI
jgi:hypothetical protein